VIGSAVTRQAPENSHNWTLVFKRLGVPLLIGVIAALASAFGPLAQFLRGLDLTLYDRAIAASESRPGRAPVTVVALNQATFDKMGTTTLPQYRQFHPELIRRLADMGVAAIVFDLEFDSPEPPGATSAFAQAILNSPVPIVVGQRINATFDRATGLTRLQIVRPAPELLQAGAQPGFIDVPAGVLRTAFSKLSVGSELDLPTLDALGLRVAGLEVREPPSEPFYVNFRFERGPDGLPDQALAFPYVDYYEAAGLSTLAHLDPLGRPGPVQPDPTLRTLEVTRRLIDAFAGRIALVGLDDKTAGAADRKETPVEAGSGGGRTVAGVIVRASIFDTLFTGDFIREAPAPLRPLVALLLGAAVALLGVLWRPWQALLAGVVASLLWFVSGNLALLQANLIVPIAEPVAAVAIAFTGTTFYRYLTEEREKNRVRSVFSRQVSAGVMEDLLRRGDIVLGGERAEGTVMFVDIRGFTDLSERMDPVSVVAILNQYLTLMAGIIETEAGTLDKYTGDGLMAIFGAPVPQADHALRAVRAACAIRDAVDRTPSPIPLDRPIRVGIGVASGEFVAGNIGSSSRSDYTAIGDTVNTAARLEGVAGPGVIRVLQTTYELVKDLVAAEALEPVRVQGKAEPLQTYAVQGVTAVSPPAASGRSAPRGGRA
jgi:adenylate cyclase